MKGFIVYSTYQLIDDRTIIQLFGRLENGQSFVSQHDFEPYLFIQEKHLRKVKPLLKKFKTEKTKQTNFQGEKVIKISSYNQTDLNKLSKAIYKKDIPTYESDIKPAMRFIIDNDLLGPIEIPASDSYKSSEKLDRIYKNPKIKPINDFKPDLKVISIDIETDKNMNELFCIGIHGKNYKKCFIITKDKNIPDSVPCIDEPDLLQKFKTELLKIDPDIITGWNVIDFDLSFLKQKFSKHKIQFDIGRSNQNPRLKIESNFFRSSTANVPGRQILDAMNMIKDPFIKGAPSIKSKKLKSYSLESVSQEILNEGKTLKGKGRHDDIEKLFRTNKKKLVEYNLQDCKLAYDILEKTKMVDLAVERATLTGMPLNKITASIAAFDSLYIREARKKNLVSPTTVFEKKSERIQGGYVMESKPGIYHNLLVLDFKSLYPSIIKTFNIDPSSYLEKKEKNSIESPNKAYFINRSGILPGIIEKLHQAREKAKKEKRELSVYAIKIIMNCFSPDTEILTENGLKKIKETKIGEKVYSINPKNNNTELHPITRKFLYPYKGKIIKIKSNVVDYLVTPNHRFMVDFGKGYEWKTADQLVKSKQNFWLPAHTKISGSKPKEIELEKLCKKHKIPYRKKGERLQKDHKHSSIISIFKMKDWLEFMGWYLSEGSIYTSKPKRYPGKISWRGITKRVTINQKIKDKRKKIENLLKKMQLKFSKDINGMHISNHILAEILEKEAGIGSNSKKIPSWMYKLDSELLTILFNSMMEGDGDSNGERYSTKSENLAKDFLRLVHHIGIYGFIYKDKQKYRGEDYTMFRVQVNRKRGIRPHISPKRNISIEKFDDNVLCVEVKPHHTVLAGRNTKLNFCGQSFFGVLASPNCRYFSLKMANAITHFGQHLIKLTAKKN